MCVLCLRAPGKKEGEGEDGIAFDNEDEKQQWEEDQKVIVAQDPDHVDSCHSQK